MNARVKLAAKPDVITVFVEGNCLCDSLCDKLYCLLFPVGHKVVFFMWAERSVQHKFLDWCLFYWSLNDEYDHLNLLTHFP